VSTESPAPARRRYIDWARGIAVLIMIEAHTLDAWTRLDARSSKFFGYLLLLGGFAAPLFLWLAGLGLVLSAERVLARSAKRSVATEAVVHRGVEIFLLAFLFRLQAFVVSPGGSLVTLFRVDILNVMGPAMVLAGILWGLSGTPRRAAAVCGAAATLLAMATPVIRNAAWVNALPLWFQWYLRPSADHTTFTLLPWAGFVLAGAAFGCVLALAKDERTERRLLSGLTAAGAVVLAAGFFTASRPTIYQASNFWTSSPTYFAVRVGILMLALAAFFALSGVEPWFPRTFGVLERFGRNSLFIYWIHVELVYGYTTWVIHRRLPLWGTAIACLAFCAVMYGAILGRDRIRAWWRSFRHSKSTPSARVAARA
jgi:uncharacterized membrane protein